MQAGEFPRIRMQYAAYDKTIQLLITQNKNRPLRRFLFFNRLF